jgi:hypothetical protein
MMEALVACTVFTKIMYIVVAGYKKRIFNFGKVAPNSMIDAPHMFPTLQNAQKKVEKT